MTDLRTRRAELRIEFDRLAWRLRMTQNRLDVIAKELDTLNIEILVSGIGEERMYPMKKLSEPPKQKVMISKRLAHALVMQDLHVRRAFANLPEVHQKAVEDALKHHHEMCRKCGLEPDDKFLSELIKDVRSGVHFLEVV